MPIEWVVLSRGAEKGEGSGVYRAGRTMSQRVCSNVGCAQVPLSTEISPAASTVPDTPKRNLGGTLAVLGGTATLRKEPDVSWTPATEAQD